MNSYISGTEIDETVTSIAFTDDSGGTNILNINLLPVQDFQNECFFDEGHSELII